MTRVPPSAPIARRSTRRMAVAAALVCGLAIPALAASGPALASGPSVLRVGSWHGQPGDFTTIQAAVDAAAPGDWILVGPGDYHERADYTAANRPAEDEAGGAVMITKPNLHVRGMDRNGVIVDGTLDGGGACGTDEASQDFGPTGPGGDALGRNGVEVFKADGVSVENLTACNFLKGAGDGGNEIWFNGGDGSGQIGMGPFRGAFLSATTTFYKDADSPTASYGIFASNASGPGLIAHTYASNMDDASYYVGACPDCNTVVTDAHAQNSALGYSGTNSGGHLIIENSEWDNNKTGIVTNSQNNDDAPSPQDGACPNGGTGPTGSHSCSIWRHNYIHDNNNPNVPQAGSAAAGPVGTGMVIAGGRDDTVIHNRVTNNGAWGILLAPYPDIGDPPPIADCQGGIQTPALPDETVVCYFDDWGNEVAHNRLANNGFFGNVSNGDLAEISNPNAVGNCWHGNVDTAGPLTSDPPLIQTTHGICGIPNSGNTAASPLGVQALCDTEIVAPCPNTPLTDYPRATQVELMPLPVEPGMRDPCRGVPANPWC